MPGNFAGAPREESYRDGKRSATTWSGTDEMRSRHGWSALQGLALTSTN